MYEVNRRTFLIGAAGTITLLGLAACTPGQTQTNSPLTGPTDPSDEQSIKVWDYDPTGIDAWVAADEEFGAYFADKYPAISVDISRAPFGGFAEALLTSIAGGAKYDVIYGWSNWLPQFRQNRVVQPLDPFLASEADLSADSFYDYGKDMSDGDLYGLAWYASAQFLFFNKTAFEAAGLDDPATLDAAGKWDFDALRSAAEALTSGSGTETVFGMDLSGTRGTGDFSAFSRAWGSDIWNADLTESEMDSAANQELYAYIRDFFASRIAPTPSEGFTLSETVGFGNERIMMGISGANYFRTADQAGVADRFEIGLSRLPSGPGGQHHVCFINSYYMGTKGENTNGGWAWYKERSFSETANDLYTSTGAGRFPVRRDLEPASVYDFEDVEFFNSIREEMFATRVIDEQAKFDDAFGTTWDELALQDGDIAAGLANLATTADQLVA